MGELLCGNSTKLEQKVSNTEEIHSLVIGY